MEGLVTSVRIIVITIITALLAAGTWLRCRLETLLILLPGRAADGPGGRKRISRVRRLEGEVGIAQ
ncbi:hypothetical protein [Streptomyces sp. WAC08241]|uniref:hypothetical protein n=1 Tax=Streptomyces sp. WAC08241 TaxID=2487421 RepID=UPI000F7A5EC8|nr:hypothetical protein [Streptomyces sp. WAC08241]RSS42761.1 hypothetical protein EF906_11490 [Streptomyces sp. WAC08241]